jgi:bifunctional UDP-N-acetylglucosamine pyrophosphorylase / glucosamine-1-phosphate N-acetyltransferase
MKNQIVILAAGKGSRMGDGTTPKVLVMLKSKPLILHLLDELEKVSQLAKPVIVVGYMHTQVMGVLGEGYTYAFQREQLGTGHAVMSAEQKIKAENIVVLYGDMPFIKAVSLKKLIQLHLTQQATMSMFTATAPDFSGDYESLNGFGRIIRDPYGNITKITEYKDASQEERKILEVNPGIYMFKTSWLFENIHAIRRNNTQGEYYLTDMVEIAIQKGVNIYSLPINPKEVMGVNTVEQLQMAEKLV